MKLPLERLDSSVYMLVGEYCESSQVKTLENTFLKVKESYENLKKENTKVCRDTLNLINELERIRNWDGTKIEKCINKVLNRE